MGEKETDQTGDPGQTGAGGHTGEDNSNPPNSSGGNPSNGEGNGSGGNAEKRFTQEEMNALAAKVRDEERRKLQKSSEEAKLKEQGEFQKLYEAEKTKTEELQAKAAAAEDYAKRINSSIEAEVKDWPASLKKLDPGTEDVSARLNWVEAAREVQKELMKTKTPPNGENGRRNPVNGGAQDPAEKYIGSTYKVPEHLSPRT